jgi:hypothetical protein
MQLILLFKKRNSKFVISINLLKEIMMPHVPNVFSPSSPIIVSHNWPFVGQSKIGVKCKANQPTKMARVCGWQCEMFIFLLFCWWCLPQDEFFLDGYFYSLPIQLHPFFSMLWTKDYPMGRVFFARGISLGPKWWPTLLRREISCNQCKGSRCLVFFLLSLGVGFLLCSLEVLNVFPNVFSIAPHFYHLCFGKCWPKGRNSIFQNRTFYFGSLHSFIFFEWWTNQIGSLQKLIN